MESDTLIVLEQKDTLVSMNNPFLHNGYTMWHGGHVTVSGGEVQAKAGSEADEARRRGG